MKNSVGVVICNYNKCQYLLRCVDSVMNQTFQAFDVYIIDNASTDDSVERLRTVYGGSITIIENKENLGGTGGFNTGMDICLEKGYDYILMLDNDIEMDHDVLERLYLYMMSDLKLAAAGAKIHLMDRPEYLQEYGSHIDFDKCENIVEQHDCLDTDMLPDVIECDYIPACCALVRTSVMDKIGGFPRDNFIYWDDIEMFYRFRKAGYGVVSIGQAHVRHCHSIFNSPTTFNKYYFTRNKLYFFSKYVSDGAELETAKTLLKSIFDAVYGCHQKKMNNVIGAFMYALLDFLSGVTGKAQDSRIKIYDSETITMELILNQSKTVVIEYGDLYEDRGLVVLNNVIGKLRKISNTIKVYVNFDEYNFRENYRLYQKYISLYGEESIYLFDQLECRHDYPVFRMCDHVTGVSEDILPKIYVDYYLNCIYDDKTFAYFTNYQNSLELFQNMYIDVFVNRIKQLKCSVSKVSDIDE